MKAATSTLLAILVTGFVSLASLARAATEPMRCTIELRVAPASKHPHRPRCASRAEIWFGATSAPSTVGTAMRAYATKLAG